MQGPQVLPGGILKDRIDAEAALDGRLVEDLVGVLNLVMHSMILISTASPKN